MLYSVYYSGSTVNNIVSRKFTFRSVKVLFTIGLAATPRRPPARARAIEFQSAFDACASQQLDAAERTRRVKGGCAGADIENSIVLPPPPTTDP